MSTSAAGTIRDLREDDLPAVLAVNQEHVPEVGPLDADRLAALVAQAAVALVVEDEAGDVGGFLLALGPGQPYASPNYRWFAARYDDFAYVDRVAVRSEVRGRGTGRQLYDEVVARTGAPWLLAEVNLVPRNDASLAFHDRLGFVEVGQQDLDGGATRVVLLARRTAA